MESEARMKCLELQK
uniref:Uncharacterized protein n=1 Tax=Lepeophtheirus salmonis TaxID=72036 RepID=A0A0K2VGQ3_LEPSM